jgi:ABC-type multidrug transport system ATPase subunit
VERVLSVLRLTRIADSFIGSPDTGGISGGERRRVTIGIELVTRPSLLLLDEPISGLDSTNASLVMEVLRDISDAGCACLLSIHQSSSSIFAMFDRLLLLAPNGKIAYFGPARQAFDFMTQVGFRMPAQNPPTVPEFLLDVAMGAQQDLLCKRYSESKVFECTAERLQKLRHAQAQVSSMDQTVTVQMLSSTRRQFSRPSRSCGFQLFCLLARSFRNVARDPALLLTHIVVTTCVAIAMGSDLHTRICLYHRVRR